MLIQPLTPEILEKRRRFRRKVLSLPGRFWRKTRRGFLWTLAIAFVGHCALNIYASALLNRELATIRQKGEPLQFAEIAPPAVPDSQNAAPVYRQALNSLRFSKEERVIFLTPQPSRTQAMNQMLETALRRNQRALGLVRRAALMPQYQSPSYGEGDNLTTLRVPNYSDLRESAQLLAEYAKLEAKDGNTSAALRDVRAIFGISHHLAKPYLVSFIVAQSIDLIANQTLSQVLKNAPLTLAQAQAFDASLPTVDWQHVFHRSLMGERTLSISIFERLLQPARADSTSDFLNSISTFWASYPVNLIGRPILKLDEVQSLRLWRKHIDADTATKTFNPSTPAAIVDEINQKIPYYALITRNLFPIFLGAISSRDFAEVRRRQREIALALTCYRTERGQYPNQLRDVVKLWKKALPLDPYSKKSFVYRKDENSFLLYSVGVNRRDGGGKARCWTANRTDPNADDISWDGLHR